MDILINKVDLDLRKQSLIEAIFILKSRLVSMSTYRVFLLVLEAGYCIVFRPCIPSLVAVITAPCDILISVLPGVIITSAWILRNVRGVTFLPKN